MIFTTIGDALVKQLGQQYPIWYQDFKSADKYVNADPSGTEPPTQIFRDGQAPAGSQTEGVKVLLDSFDVAATEYAQAGAGQSYSKQQYAQSQVYDAYVNYLETTRADYPALSPIIETVFMHALKAPA